VEVRDFLYPSRPSLASYSIGTGGFFPTVEWPRRGFNHPNHPEQRLKKIEKIYYYFPFCAFMACCTANWTFTFTPMLDTIMNADPNDREV
jgi:hypothetical protein